MTNLRVKSGAAQLAVSRDDRNGAGDAAAPVPALVFLHAGVADKRSWVPLIGELAATMGSTRYVSYDRRGFGESTFTEARYSRVGDLIEVLDACEISSAVLVGNSQGGRVAIDTAIQHPKRVRALVLIGTAVGGSPDAALYPLAVSTLSDEIDAAEAVGDLERMNRLEAHLWLDGPLAPEGRVTGEVRELFLDMNRRALNAPNAGDVTDSNDAWNKLANIQVPVLVIIGNLDLPHLQERSAHIAKVIPNAELVSMNDVAHLPALEAPGRCAEIISRFVANVRVGTG
jgi:pimeloyl-ACP methyl ester carboxylesterase